MSYLVLELLGAWLDQVQRALHACDEPEYCGTDEDEHCYENTVDDPAPVTGVQGVRCGGDQIARHDDIQADEARVPSEAMATAWYSYNW